MGNVEDKKTMSKFDKILITIGSIGGIFATAMALYLDPIKEQVKNNKNDIKEVKNYTQEQIKIHCNDNDTRFDKLEIDIKEIEKDKKEEQKETNKRLRNIEKMLAILVSKRQN